MQGPSRIILSAALRAGVWAGVAGAGLLFPVDFSAQIDSLRMSLRPAEVVANASFAWVLYFAFSALAGAFAGGVIAALLLALDRYNDRAIRLFIHLTIALLLGQLFVRELFRLAPLNNDLIRWVIIAVSVVGLAAWLVARHGAVLDRVGGFLWAVTTVGALVAGVTILSAFIGSRSGPDGRLPASGSRSRVILISVDSLAANRMSLYGYFRDTTPSLNKFAQQAFVFDRHYTNGNFTTPSIDSILTGTRPWVHRVFQLNARPRPYIAQLGLIPTLKRSGYRTMAVATNAYAMPELHRVAGSLDRERVSRVEPIEFKDLQWFPTFGSVFFFPTVERIQGVYRRLAYWHYTSNLHFDPESAFAEARALLTAESHSPAEFLWIHLFPPHEPYAAPAPFLRSFDPSDKALTINDSRPPILFAAKTYPGFPGVFSARYDEAIRYVDYHIGSFLNWLKQEGYYENSLIVVTADHGESFAHSYGSHSGPMLYEDLIHVPLIVKLPGQHTGSRIRDVVTEHADLFPTIADCIGVRVPGRVEGRSLRPAMEGRPVQPNVVFSMNFEQNSVSGPLQKGTVAMVKGQYKYVRHLGRVSYPYMPEIHDEFYDVVNDPSESTNLIASRPEIAATYRAAIDAAISQHRLP